MGNPLKQPVEIEKPNLIRFDLKVVVSCIVGTVGRCDVTGGEPVDSDARDPDIRVEVDPFGRHVRNVELVAGGEEESCLDGCEQIPRGI